MLRVQAHRDEDAALGDGLDEDETFVAVAVADGPPAEQKQETEKELLETDEQFLWMLLQAAVAECVTTCFWPGYTLRAWGLNVGGSALNWVGPFLDGVTYGYEDRLKGTRVSVACLQFRSAFLGVFTSYSFMADHAGDLSSSSFAAGPLYVCASILGGCGCFWLGKRAVTAAWMSPVTAQVSRVVNGVKIRPSQVTCLVTFVALTALRAMMGAHGFVRDPNDPQFIGPVQVADGEELVLGILMSCSAVLLSNYVCELFPPQPSQLRTAASRNGGPFIDWGCLCCNFLSCVLAGATYQLSRISPTGVTNNLLALKFVSSFCGSLSVFSGAVSIVSRLWLAGNRHSALWNLSLQLLVGLLVIPYLYKYDAA
ncbi:putative fluoride ion transporter CrcB [Phytophthora cinnamomi]|uniref:putative fluoride ion transporter CrcB n=1 Tax=Phytophthora cinnamomi TaxID=4785 RepID=UPI00355A268E|nr:putative fluoride ion transporter CrcB [Phytophthora cinnamomi]